MIALFVHAQYINFLAGFADYLAYIKVAPILPDVAGGGLHIVRVNMWLWTTPAMVYLLSIISDFTWKRVQLAMLADFAMISCLVIGSLQTNIFAGGEFGGGQARGLPAAWGT
jgi:bacteriorhodopsin